VVSIDIGLMRRHERTAIEQNVPFDAAHGLPPGETDRNLPVREDGRVRDLVWPILTLIAVTVAGALWIGIAGAEGSLAPMDVLAATDVILALFYGTILACLVAAAMLLVRRTPGRVIGKAAASGVRSMFFAAAVLFLAWITAEVIGELGIGEYLAGVTDEALPLALSPVILFVSGPPADADNLPRPQLVKAVNGPSGAETSTGRSARRAPRTLRLV
jgi:tetracycline resistance efflux pump